MFNINSLTNSDASAFISVNVNYTAGTKEIINYYDKERTKIKSIYRLNLDGRLNGKSEGWFKNGNKHFELNYINGSLHGTQTIYWVNRNPFLEFNFREGKLFGSQTEYFINGTAQFVTLYTSARNNDGLPFIP